MSPYAAPPLPTMRWYSPSMVWYFSGGVCVDDAGRMRLGGAGLAETVNFNRLRRPLLHA